MKCLLQAVWDLHCTRRLWALCAVLVPDYLEQIVCSTHPEAPKQAPCAMQFVKWLEWVLHVSQTLSMGATPGQFRPRSSTEGQITGLHVLDHALRAKLILSTPWVISESEQNALKLTEERKFQGSVVSVYTVE